MSTSPNDFLDKLGPSAATMHLLNKYKIFTIRQLAECDFSLLERSITTDDFQNLESIHFMALQVVQGYEAKPKKREDDTDVWAYCYIGEELYNSIKNGGDYKSPYVLFEEYMNCESPEERNKHLWKSVYFRHMKAASESMGVAIPSDSDVYSYLLWRDTKTIGQFDVTGGGRAIPFLWEWMDGDYHGQCIMIDRINATELNEPTLKDRYAYQIAINLSLCIKNGGKIYDFDSRRAVNARSWAQVKLEDASIKKKRDKDEVWFSFNPGDDYTEKVPHGCIVTPDGVIPNSMMFVFVVREVTIRDV